MTQSQGQQEHPLDLSAVFEALDRPLALIDSPERRAEIERYLQTARIHLERAILDLIAGVLQAVNAANGGVRVRLQYEAGAPSIVVEAAEAGAANEQEPVFTVEGDVEKVTIRLPKELKELIDQAASLGGRSANAWYIRELGRSVSRFVRDEARREDDQRRHGRRGWRPGGSLRGFVGDD